MAKKGVAVWFTGLSCAGKTTIAQALEKRLTSDGIATTVLDGDVVRQSITMELGFGRADRDENIRRIGFLAHLLTRDGTIVLVAAVSPFREVRDEVKKRIGDFVEVFVSAPLELCQQRDVSGFYRRVRDEGLKHVAGIDEPYEQPLNPGVKCQTDVSSVDECVDQVYAELVAQGYVNVQ